MADTKKRLEQRITKTQGKLEVILTVALFKEDKYYVAYCPALELSTYATNMEKVKREFTKELDIFFKETIRKATLERLLLKYGWTLQMKEFRPPSLSVNMLNQFKDYPNFNLREEKVQIPC